MKSFEEILGKLGKPKDIPLMEPDGIKKVLEYRVGYPNCQSILYGDKAVPCQVVSADQFIAITEEIIKLRAEGWVINEVPLLRLTHPCFRIVAVKPKEPIEEPVKEVHDEPQLAAPAKPPEASAPKTATGRVKRKNTKTKRAENKDG